MEAHADVGGDSSRPAGTGTYDINSWATEIQAGSYALMDYGLRPARPALPPGPVHRGDRDLGVTRLGGGRLRPEGARHGPRQPGRSRAPRSGSARTSTSPSHRPRPVKVGDRVRVIPAHVDPTVSRHETHVRRRRRGRARDLACRSAGLVTGYGAGMSPDSHLLAGTDVSIPLLGVGTWAWGDRSTWGMGGYDSELTMGSIEGAWNASIDAGVTLFDTAEVYGRGESERIIGQMRGHDPRSGGFGRSRHQIHAVALETERPWRVAEVAASVAASPRRVLCRALSDYTVP